MSGKDVEAAAEYALGALDGSERSAFEARLAEDPTLQKIVSRWEQRLAPIAQEAPAVTPSPALRLRLIAALNESAQREASPLLLGTQASPPLLETQASPSLSEAQIIPLRSRKLAPARKFIRPAVVGIGGLLAASLAFLVVAPQDFWISRPNRGNGGLETRSQPVASVSSASAEVGNSDKPHLARPEYAGATDCLSGPNGPNNVQTASAERPAPNPAGVISGSGVISGVSVASGEKNNGPSGAVSLDHGAKTADENLSVHPPAQSKPFRADCGPH